MCPFGGKKTFTELSTSLDSVCVCSPIYFFSLVHTRGLLSVCSYSVPVGHVSTPVRSRGSCSFRSPVWGYKIKHSVRTRAALVKGAKKNEWTLSLQKIRVTRGLQGCARNDDNDVWYEHHPPFGGRVQEQSALCILDLLLSEGVNQLFSSFVFYFLYKQKSYMINDKYMTCRGKCQAAVWFLRSCPRCCSYPSTRPPTLLCNARRRDLVVLLISRVLCLHRWFSVFCLSKFANNNNVPIIRNFGK